MTYFKKVHMKGAFIPDYVASAVDDIDFMQLSRDGVKCIAFDIDGTIAVNRALVMDETLAKMLVVQLDKAGIRKRFLASNSNRSLNDFLKPLKGFKAHQPINFKGKPFKEYFIHLANSAELRPDQIVMVGDRFIQDIIGANHAGFITVQVALNPAYATLRDKIILRQFWNPFLVKRKF